VDDNDPTGGFGVMVGNVKGMTNIHIKQAKQKAAQLKAEENKRIQDLSHWELAYNRTKIKKVGQSLANNAKPNIRDLDEDYVVKAIRVMVNV